MSTVLVTGGSRGIGAAVAALAARDGWDVAIVYHTQRARAEAVAGTVRAQGRRARLFQADIADRTQILALFRQLDAAGLRLAGLVNSAGTTGPTTTLAAARPADVEQVLALNLEGAFWCLQEAARRMARSRGGAGGSIVNVSSRAAELGGAGEWLHYAASKGGLDSLTIGAARELGPEGIRVNAVSPGLIDTEIHAAAGDAGRLERLKGGVPLGRVGTAEEVAEAVIWLLSDKAAYVSGAILPVSGGR